MPTAILVLFLFTGCASFMGSLEYDGKKVTITDAHEAKLQELRAVVEEHEEKLNACHDKIAALAAEEAEIIKQLSAQLSRKKKPAPKPKKKKKTWGLF